MSRVGSLEQGAADDGIRTGWVCVNIGAVEDGDLATEQVLEIEGFVGFGSQSDGTKVVVQMLTEEKREELDLERLWSQALARQERRKKRLLKGVEDMKAEDIAEGMPDHEHDRVDQKPGFEPFAQAQQQASPA